MASHHSETTVPGMVQDALARIGTMLETLFDTAEDAIFLMDGVRLVDCNPATLGLFGCTKADIVGQSPIPFSPALQPDGSSSVEKVKTLVMSTMEGAPQHFEWRHRRLDGTEFDVDVRMNRFVVGSAPFVVAVSRDITDRKRSEAALRRELLAHELVNRILARCAVSRPCELDGHMEDSLEELAAFLQVDHAYFLLRSPDRTSYSCTHEVSGPGVGPLRARLQGVPIGTHGSLERTALAGMIVRVESLRDSGPDPGSRSVLLVPTRDASGESVGALGVDTHARQRSWSDSDALLCSTIGNALTGMADRVRVADKLLQEKDFSDRLIASLPGIFYAYDAGLRLRRWNRNHEGLGYTPSELDGMRMEDWFREEARSAVIATARGVLQMGGAIDFIESELVRKDGRVVPFLFSGAHVDSPTGPMLVGVGIDLTARLEAEKALAASEQSYRELFDATHDALVIHDEAAHVLDVNESARAMFGFDADHARRLSIGDLSLGEPPFSQHEGLEKIKRAIDEGPQVFDWQSRRVDGTLFWSEVALRVFQHGGVRRVIASVRDITERKLAAIERERLMAEAQSANTAKDRFLAVLSHELRNPLAAIQAGASVLRGLASDDARTVRAVDVIERNVKLQARLVNDLLGLSRLVRGKLTLQRAPLQLDAIVLSAVDTCRADAARANVTLTASAEASLWALADADRIQQLVINLVDNAIKFTPSGGRVTVSVKTIDHRGRVVVEDTGAGIEESRLEEIFEMFWQGQVAARRAPGLGIGLALVKSIAEMHGGRAWAESEGPGCGSRFIVELPLSAAPGASPASEAPGPERAPLKMLLLEDNSDTRSMLAETFAGLAYLVVPAESSEAALEILTHQAVDVIVADVGLPGMDGYEFLHHARHLPSAASSLAFALTGFGQERDVQRSLEAGYIEHFVKPVDPQEIDRRIRSRFAAAHAP